MSPPSNRHGESGCSRGGVCLDMHPGDMEPKWCVERAASPVFFAAALARYRESLRYWEGIDDLGSVTICLEAIPWAVCILGDAKRAALLLRAAQKRHEEGEYPMPERVLSSFGGVVAGVHACLGPAAFAEAWLAGRDISLDAAVTEACRADPGERGMAARPAALVPDRVRQLA